MTDAKPKFDPRIQTEDIAFDASELIACGGCSRPNPPNRPACLYCGHVLELTELGGDQRLELRQLESWEPGSNVVIADAADSSLISLGKLFEIEPEDLTAVANAGAPLPIARVGSHAEASLIQERLQSEGVTSLVVADDALAADKSPTRLSRIELGSDGIEFRDFNTGRLSRVAPDDLVLIVEGLVTESRVDSTEKRGRGGKFKILDESSTIASEPVVDLYTRHDSTGFRVFTAGFDFSTLGTDKSLIATENLARLINRLRAIAPQVKYDKNYKSMRAVLGMAWPVDTRTDSQGLKRVGFGKREFGTSATSNNLGQFTKYSRLQWHLL